jgi:hypothetical protein
MGVARLLIRKQAVIVIHGIGEQQPMATLRSLLETLVGQGYESRPDRMSELREARRLRALDAMRDPHEPDLMLETDFYELFWAHHVRNTSLGSMLGWLWGLYLRPVTARVAQARRLRRLKRGLTAVMFCVVAVVILAAISSERIVSNPLVGPAVAMASLVLSRVGLQLLLSPLTDTLGDAARYLSPRPGNVSARERVLESGVELLRGLHSDPNVHRIVMLGHSLGGIIGYDVLSAYWREVHVDVPVPARTLKAVGRAGEALVADPGPELAQAYRAAQADAFRDARDFGRKPRRRLSRQRPLRPWWAAHWLTLTTCAA